MLQMEKCFWNNTQKTNRKWIDLIKKNLDFLQQRTLQTMLADERYTDKRVIFEYSRKSSRKRGKSHKKVKYINKQVKKGNWTQHVYKILKFIGIWETQVKTITYTHQLNKYIKLILPSVLEIGRNGHMLLWMFRQLQSFWVAMWMFSKINYGSS